MANNFSIAIHGGAGTILRSTMTRELQTQYEAGLRDALDTGYNILARGGSSLDAVEAAVVKLEDFPLFNAGKGAVFNNVGGHEMDAAIMSGKGLEAGAACGISHVKNPVKLARAIMDHSEHVILCGAGAEQFARTQNLAFEDDAYFYMEQRYQQWQEALKEGRVQLDHSDKKFGTVGAVAFDLQGNLAAATSTGGMTNKKFGRIGDSPVPGAGTYANNNTCAISCLMEYKGISLKEACDVVVYDKLVKIGGEGGLIAIDKLGNIEMPFNSDGMYRACRNSAGRNEISIYRE